MNSQLKNYLGASVIIAVLVFAYAALVAASAYSRIIEPASFRSFSVSAESKKVAIPDVAETTFSAITEGGQDIANLQKENSEKTNKIVSFVKSQGVDAKDIKTQNYSIEPRYENLICPRGATVCPPPQIVGYTIRSSYLLKIRDFEKISVIVGGVVQNGANSVSGLSFTIDDPTMVENEARTEAITKAKAKAEFIAQAGGFRLGRLLSIEEGGFPGPIFKAVPYGAGGDFEGRPTAPPAIEPGSQEVIVNITLRYEIR